LRAAKDLGRVLALAWLAGPDETSAWLDLWIEALQACFPGSWRGLCRRAGTGLGTLLDDDAAFEEAHFTTTVGLLSGLGVTQPNLRAVSEQLKEDLLIPVALRGRRRL
jgi:hypothetical protein